MFETEASKETTIFSQPFSVWNKPVRFFGPRPEEEGERDRIRGSEIGMQFVLQWLMEEFQLTSWGW